MPTTRGRIYPRLKDPRIEAEVANIYDIVQNLKVDAGSIDALSVGQAVGKAMKDGQFEPLERFLTGKYQGQRILLNNTLDQGYTIYAIKGTGTGFPTGYFSLNQAGVETVRMENQAKGPALYCKNVGAGGTSGIQADALVYLDNPGTGDTILASTGSPAAKLTSAGVWTDASSKKLKENFKEAKGEDVARKIKKLKVYEYNYIRQPDRQHIGPTSEDFFDIFKVGDNQGISGRDLAAVAISGVKFLLEKVDALEKKVKELEAKNGTYSAGV